MDRAVEPQGASGSGGSLSEGRPFSSLVSKLVLLMLIFITVPLILYSEFRQADFEKRTLLLDNVRQQGRVIAESLRPLLQQTDPSPLPQVNAEIERFATPQMGIKVLYRPQGEFGAGNFFFVASQPPVPAAELDAERDQLVQRGVFDNLSESCRGELPIALRHNRPTGEEELLTSITPITSDSGCWAVITTHSTIEFLGTAIGQPYWQTLEVRLAAAIYLGMAVITIGLFVSIWRNLMRFRYLARHIRTGEAQTSSFTEHNRVPELALVAEEFDRMTAALRDSAESIRLAAEDNAHAFKTPIAIMRQSLEPLRRIVSRDDPRGQRALDVIELSVDRLDHLVAYARRLDEATAELLDPPRQRIDLSEVSKRMATAYVDTFASRRVQLDRRIEPNIHVRASEDLLETVLENLIDNAIEVSPAGSTMTIGLRKQDGRAELTVLDEGPGVPHQELARIFERYVSLGPKTAGKHLASDDPKTNRGEEGGAHLGIGLWIVRRNLQAVGGTVRAQNRPNGGLALIVQLPLAD